MKIKAMALRTIRQKPLQFGGSALLLAVAVMLFVTLSSTMALMDSSNQLFREEYNQEDFQFTAGERLSEDELASIEKEFGVNLQARQWLDIEWKEGVTARILSVQQGINEPYVVKGRLPDEKNEAAITASFADAHGLKVGDSFDAGGKTCKITAHVYLPDYIYGVQNENDLMADPKTFGVILMAKEDFPGGNQPPVYYSGRFLETSGSLSSLKKTVAETVAVLKWVDAKDNVRISYIDAEIESNQSFGSVLPVFIGILALFMVVLMLKRQIDVQSTQIGTLLALGYTRKEVTLSFMLYPLIIAIAGTVLGIAAGLIAAGPLTELYTAFYNLPILNRLAFDPVTLIAGFAVPISVLCLAGFLTVRKKVNQPPLQLLHSRPSFSKKGAIKLPLKWSFKRRFRLKMLLTSPSKSLVLFTGILFSSLLVTFGFISMNSMNVLMKKTYEDAYRYNYAIYYQEVKTEPVSAEESPFSAAEAIIKGKDGRKDVKTQLVGMDSSTSMLKLIDSSGTELNGTLPEGAVVTQALAAAEGLKAGDSITIQNPWTDQEQSVTITGVAEIFIGHAIYMERRDVNRFLNLEEDAYIGKWTLKKESGKAIAAIEDKNAMKKGMEQLLEPTNYSAAVIGVFAFLIGLIIIYLITSMMMDEHTVNISLLKVMGYDRKEISSLLLNVYTPVVIAGYVLGVPLAFISYKGLMASVSESTGFSLPIEPDYLMIAAGFIIIYASYVTSLQLSKRKISRIPLQEVLKRQE
ncbi:ABC transporter permease [Peribacillus frigoritolerans]|uniref:ABC transporter permease n=1 Tax=Peribacillus frigoritolerans TaxID=450367 RepID=UPI00140471AA|nr:ABC transporter permease [Peribacillus frigoritolerans]